MSDLCVVPLEDADAERMRAGVHAYGCADLAERHGAGEAEAAQHGDELAEEVLALAPVPAEADAEAEEIYVGEALEVGERLFEHLFL